jgi:hypothetical protein
MITVTADEPAVITVASIIIQACLMIRKVMLLLVIPDISYLMMVKWALHQADNPTYLLLKTVIQLLWPHPQQRLGI